MKKNTIRTPRQGWEYWRLNRIDDDSLQWLAISRPEARAVIDRSKVWTLIPDRRLFVANWFGPRIISASKSRASGSTRTSTSMKLGTSPSSCRRCLRRTSPASCDRSAA